MTGTLDQTQIVSIKDLLKENLNIPNYQRPYKWGVRNIQTLLTDIEEAISEATKFSDFKYRIGTIILHKDGETYNIVDGQQRTISFVLICKYLYEQFDCSILKHEFTNRDSKTNIYYNYAFIQDWFSQKQDKVDVFKNAMDNILEVVTICVDEISEAFQLFDSQNSRGKALDPHHLLKAYHLREMKSDPYAMVKAVTKWENKKSAKIKNLFADYLFPIWNWSTLRKAKDFSTKDIDVYKGISEHSPYTYAKRVNKAMPYFQITEPFVAGNNFFEMVDHYLFLLKSVKQEIQTNTEFESIKELIEKGEEKHSVGFKYARELFYCALLCYYDRFHNFDPFIVKKLCKWAFMIRVDRELLGFDSINKYAIGESNYTKNANSNNIPMFERICRARTHTDLAMLQVTLKKPSQDNEKNWLGLYDALTKL
jgi:uncharacterized protein with ParB-like and HNH nuclease domain